MSAHNEIIDYLKSYKELKFNVIFYRNKMTGLKAIEYSQEAKGTAIKNLMNVYLHKIDVAEKEMNEIEQFVEKNFSGFVRLAMWARYIDCRTYKEVVVFLEEKGYSYSIDYIRVSILNAINRSIDTV